MPVKQCPGQPIVPGFRKRLWEGGGWAMPPALRMAARGKHSIFTGSGLDLGRALILLSWEGPNPFHSSEHRISSKDPVWMAHS